MDKITKDSTSFFINDIWAGHTELKLLSWQDNNNCKVVLNVFDKKEQEFIADLEDGFSAEVRYYETGRPDIQANGELLYKLTDCAIRRKWISEIVPFFYDGGLTPLTIYFVGKLSYG